MALAAFSWFRVQHAGFGMSDSGDHNLTGHEIMQLIRFKV